MKRKLALFLAICLLATLCATPAFAVSPAKTLPYPEGSTVTYLANGDYLVTSVAVTNNLTRGTDKTVSKTSTYYSNDVARCALTVYGAFTYDGYTAQYRHASYTFNAYDNAWSLDSPASYGTSGSTATGTAKGVFVKKFLGVTVTREPVTVTVYCDLNGNVW